MVFCSHFFVFDNYIFIIFGGVFLALKKIPGVLYLKYLGMFSTPVFLLFWLLSEYLFSSCKIKICRRRFYNK